MNVMNGKYTVEVLGKSSGPYRSRLRNMVVKSVAELAKKEDGVEVHNVLLFFYIDKKLHH